jgi:Pregnancy-associated plasma protein-A
MHKNPKDRDPKNDQDPRAKRIRRCATMDQHWRLVRKSPEYRWRSRQVEADVQDWIARYGRAGVRTGLIRIPVVVHVIHNTAAQNILDAQIHSQIAVLNADFRRLNADAASTPAPFTAVAADARLEFALAVRGPGCTPTTGITRTATSVTGWVFPSDAMKSAASGGHDPWDVNKYLNIWVVNYIDDTLGYGTFPSMPANIQGVVCDYRAFGTTGTLTPHAALGRTMTHEVGHWLDLLHIWGDDGSACSGSDSCSDTPNQAGSSPFGPCRTFPAVSCLNGPNGDMFMNYMDYSADECMNMFTMAQVARMDAALHTARAAILASDGLVPATGTPGPDLWMKDVSDDFGAEPDPSAQPMYISDDIWVRTSNDGLLNQDHQNAEYRPPGSPSNFVYVRVRNRGCTGSGTATGTLKLYWAKASTGLSWPAPWDGSVSTPALMGSLIGSQSVSVAGGDDEIAIFPWMPPNPADYASFGADQAHFCLLARIETLPTAPFGMTSPETSNLYANVQNNNNVVWKNISVVDEVPGSGRFASVIVANFTDQAERVTLTFQTPRDAKPSIFDWGEVLVELPPALLRLREGQQDGPTGYRPFNDTTFQLLEPRAKLGVFKLAPGALHTVNLRFLPRQRIPLGARVFTLDLVQEAAGRFVGGQRFVLKTVPDDHGIAVETPGAVFDGVDWVPVGHGTKGHRCCCK